MQYLELDRNTGGQVNSIRSAGRVANAVLNIFEGGRFQKPETDTFKLPGSGFLLSTNGSQNRSNGSSGYLQTPNFQNKRKYLTREINLQYHHVMKHIQQDEVFTNNTKIKLTHN